MFRKLTLFSFFLTLIIIVLSSWFRTLVVDQTLISAGFIGLVKDTIYDYLLVTLALSISVVSVLSWWQKSGKVPALMTTLLLVLLLVLQATLLVVTKTIAEMPLVIVTHIVLGLSTFWLLYWLYLRANPSITGLVSAKEPVRTGFVNMARLAMFLLGLQILLGAWVGANHAGLACSGFPQCNGQWLPSADYENALNLVNGIVSGYTGVISFDAQVAANWLHRIGALLSFLLLSAVMFSATSLYSSKPVKKAGLWLGGLLFLQIGLAIIAINLQMPFWAVPVHQLLAALLMLPLIAISFYSRFAF